MSGKLARSLLKEFEKYTSEVHFKKITGVSGRVLKLDGNENLFLNYKFINRIIRDSLSEIEANLYTDTLCQDLREALARHFHLPAEYVMVGNGADGVIDAIVKTFLEPGVSAVVVEPTYSIYKFFIKIMGAIYKPVLLEDNFSLVPEKIINACDEATKLIFMCSPNNPTGNQFQYEQVVSLLENSNNILVLDEAYAEFGNYSLIPALRKYSNLIILKTMSKAYGLASLRAGYCLANPEIIEELLKVSPPYPVNIVAQKIIPKILTQVNLILNAVNKIRKQRSRMFKQLNDINGVEAYPSDANFILFRIIDRKLTGNKVHESLLKKGVVVRNRGSLPKLENCLRVTVCPALEGEIFIEALKECMSDEL
ncbi:MAG: histidinol-phosphate transaminase [Candidatus Odinarchaeum yellowstonii]|uniref:Histidinol-phosphate aminotransferase n=1 Tax=Odinarchaeota yellowstonii (strain LCB_4) TaxID=1841599 RepID=A0AAF0IAW9_ODILC|nr:MAG: histidinol-phosphate transaminase [Candidatus Odinarchaeum yellowstonii]